MNHTLENRSSQRRSQSYIESDGLSISKSWYRAPDFCLLYMPLALASAVCLESESLGTRDHILLSQFWHFPFRRLLRLAGSRWRYSTPLAYPLARTNCLPSRCIAMDVSDSTIPTHRASCQNILCPSDLQCRHYCCPIYQYSSCNLVRNKELHHEADLTFKTPSTGLSWGFTHYNSQDINLLKYNSTSKLVQLMTNDCLSCLICAMQNKY
jgi:hypothetical protein